MLPVIDDIAAEALRAGEIIRRLRSLVRKETPRQDWIDLADVAAEILRLVAARHAPARRRRARRRRRRICRRVLGDRIQIEQVVLNLLRNAIDAMAEVDGRRELHVRIARVGGDAVELAVRDTGPRHAGRRSPSASSIRSSPPSAAASAWACRSAARIVEVHHGRLSVTPNADGGVTFHRPPAGRPATSPSVAVAAG